MKQTRVNPGAFLEFLQPKRPPSFGKEGAVTSPHYLATLAGEDIVKRGGHAAEAAIATNAVLAVVYPHMAGLGGDLMALVWDKEEREVVEFNGSGRSGQSATLEAFTDHEQIPERGPLSVVTVPGAVNAWWSLHQRYGKLEWESLFERAIHYAEQGFPVSKKFSDFIYEKRSVLEEYEETREHFLPDGAAPLEGELFRQPDLARSLTLIAEQGPKAFYDGEITEKIVASMERHGGILTREDFRRNETEHDQPISTSYHEYEVFQTRPNTQGAAALIILNILEHFDLASIGDNTPEYYHLMAEATKLAFLYRDEWITDEHDMDMDPEIFADDKVGKELADKINMQEISEGSFRTRELPIFRMNRDTAYMAVVDQEGNACSLIESVYHEFGSAFMPEGTGFLLHNRGSSFELDPDHPNNLAPDKYTFHTIIPAMMLKDGEPVMLYGTMGGEGQPQTQAALVTRVVDFGYNIQQAIEAPRWLHGRTWGADSDSLKLEGRISDVVIQDLKHRGHDVEKVEDWSNSMGHAQGITIDPETGVLGAGADPRGDGIGISW